MWAIPADPDTTAFTLLQQVNDVIPLESSTWGLEDYIVELECTDGTTFECLHFQPLLEVLDNNDQVRYVPIQARGRKIISTAIASRSPLR